MSYSASGLGTLILVCGLTLAIPSTVAEDQSLSMGSREDQILFWENELEKMRTGNLAKARHQANTALLNLDAAKQQRSWFFPSKDEEARIKVLEEEYNRLLNELAILQKQETMMLAKVKPLYGIVSRRFAKEQSEAIVGILSKMRHISFEQVQYRAIFNIDKAESVTDFIITLALEWLFSYIIMYPFAALYYALWAAPMSIYAYSSGPSDIIIGILAWVAAVVVMVLPLLFFCGAALLIHKVWLHGSPNRGARRQGQFNSG
ncbi:hypothetical protein ERJ75_001431000 [Trypanosoma vivax]|uniref:Uncharacterized protein n=1 Tax=Trypanosoma vivax (strain Y486) TaxID=1055687 RepID=G0TTN1_TRYVY|nr:hypothetical protein TRVL_00093 [Trypanosoma vivax]KAH8606892.1 hypothetical protein ERJ75_001431000 [Trypanosoma vivax]CCC47312.1 conserved hypothetical protein [Trypanosoma vivax Y486]